MLDTALLLLLGFIGGVLATVALSAPALSSLISREEERQGRRPGESDIEFIERVVHGVAR